MRYSGGEACDCQPLADAQRYPVANSCALFLFGGVKLLSTKAGKGSFQGGFQQAFISYAHAAAGFLGNQLVQQKNLEINLLFNEHQQLATHKNTEGTTKTWSLPCF
jgi:hypothetical protein